jgi:DNA repair exonuclease SbcCD ATPase subunit
MTTAIRATGSKADQLAALQEARERLEEAKQERATKDEDARAWARSVQQAQAELDRLAASEPGQFDHSGQPRPKTAAAKAKRKVDDAKTSRWPAMVKGAEDRIAECEAEVRRLTRPIAAELARSEYEAGLKAKREALVARDQLLAAIARVHASEPTLTGLANAVPGLNGTNVSIDGRWHELELLLRSIASSNRRGFRR